MPPPNRISSGRVKYYNKEGAREEMTQLYHRDFIDLVSNFNVGDRIRVKLNVIVCFCFKRGGELINVF
jgi:hypothetical protein